MQGTTAAACPSTFHALKNLGAETLAAQEMTDLELNAVEGTSGSLLGLSDAFSAVIKSIGQGMTMVARKG
jgi:hypothetical protein